MWPTTVAEIHSMSMEFFAWPMELFFKEDAKKYYYTIWRTLSYPLRVAVDEFQHFVYENPKRPRRKKSRRRIEKYSYKIYEVDFLNRGGYCQGHIFQVRLLHRLYISPSLRPPILDKRPPKPRKSMAGLLSVVLRRRQRFVP